MENKEHLTPDAGDLSRQTEERLNPQGSPLNENDETSRPVESEEKTPAGETDVPKADAKDPAEGEAPVLKKKTPAKKPASKDEKAGTPEAADANKESKIVSEAETPAPTAPDAEPAPEAETPAPTAPDAEPAPEAETDVPATQPKADDPLTPIAEKSASEAETPVEKIEPPATETETPAPTAPDAEPAPEAESPAPTAPDAPEDGTEVKAIVQAEKSRETEKSREAEKEEDLAEKYAGLSKEELVEVAEGLIKEEDVNYIRTHIGYVKAAFRKLVKEESIADFEKRIQQEGDTEEPESVENPEAAVEVPADPLTERFDKAFAIYRGKKALYDQAVEQQKQENLSIKEGILEDLRSLIESEEELKKTYDLFRDLQEKWRNVGAVPQNAKGTLWNNYHFLVEKFFDKVKINKELKDLDLKKNLEAKTELCEKAEELLLETSITKSFQRLQKFHEAWKETGPVPKDKKDEIWDRFKAATDMLNKRRQEYYDILRDEQNNNYAAKLVLCEKAELVAATSPTSPKQWQQQTNEINELFKMWKTIGFAPKKVNNEVWNRFRSSLDAFYRNKKEFFKKYKEIQTENYNQKLNLCMQAEALKENEDWRATTEDLIALQKEWKKIGPVPAKFSDKIWKRFRAACDAFFNKKSDHFTNIGEKQEENLKQKLELIEQVKSHAYSDDNVKNLDVLKEFQRKWMNIGHVPIKQKDKLQTEFRKAIDQQFEVLNISKKAKSTLSFRSKVENIKSSPQGDNILYKERNFLTNKINAIQSDIKVWENNIGFFASSKKADILKAEFEDKIEKGKEEIALLEEKLKILRES